MNLDDLLKAGIITPEYWRELTKPSPKYEAARRRFDPKCECGSAKANLPTHSTWCSVKP